MRGSFGEIIDTILVELPCGLAVYTPVWRDELDVCWHEWVVREAAFAPSRRIIRATEG